MPYIKQSLRDDLDNEIAVLGDAITELYQMGQGQRDGLLNYAITKLLLQVYPKKDESYHNYNEAMGMLESCKTEYYRRAVATYEDSKIWENGDVYPNPIQPDMDVVISPIDWDKVHQMQDDANWEEIRNVLR